MRRWNEMVLTNDVARDVVLFLMENDIEYEADDSVVNECHIEFRADAYEVEEVKAFVESII